MAEVDTPVRTPWIWVVLGAFAAIGGGIWLWFLAQPRACILIYPPPPGCNSAIPYWSPYIGVGVLAVLLVVLIVLAVRRVAPRTLIATFIVILVVAALFLAITYLAFAGVFDFPSPPLE